MYAERKSIRKYLNKEVPKEMILEIIEAARVAPSAKNRQPWKYIVFTGAKKAEILDVMDNGIVKSTKSPFIPKKFKRGLESARNTIRIMREAPVVIMVLNLNSDDPHRNASYGKRITEIHDTLSIGASVEHMLLKATELGLGTLWVGNTVFAHKEIVDYLGVKCQLSCAVCMGYPDEEPEGRPKKTIEEIVEFR